MPRSSRWVAVVGVVVLTLDGGRAVRAQAAPDTLRVNAALAERGKELFSDKQCKTCHTIGRGRAIGPDLKGVTSRRPLAWLRRMIRTPEVMLLHDSLAQALRKDHGDLPMPNMKLSEQEVEAVIHYLASRSRH